MPSALLHASVRLSYVASRYFCVSLEAALVIVLALLAMRVPYFGARYFTAAERKIAELAQRRRVAVLLVMAAALVGRALILPVIHIPEPSIHDEFSYLLAGETFASGRVTNKPHPMWIHFESVHILQQPTYMSMYQPAQGLFLALGSKIAKEPWVGVWIATILMSGAMCWMLQAWLPPAWALAGGLLAVVRWGIFSYWVNSYWGGAVPALGGALVVGSLPRLLRHGRLRDALLLGTGFALLANSRPYEGLVFSSTVTITFIAWTVKRRLWRRILKPKTVSSVFLLLSVVAAGILYYNWRITGLAMQLPYIEDRQQYAMAPLFLWRALKPEPTYHSSSLRRVYLAEVEVYRKARLNWGVPEMFRKLKDFWLFYIGPLFTLPLLSLWLHSGTRRDERTNLFLLILVVMLVAVLGGIWFYAHYAAPATCVVLALILQGMRNLRRYRWRGKPVGLFLARAIPVGCLLMAAIPLSTAALGLQLNYWPLQWYGGTPDIVRPTSLTAPLIADHRKALILVKYSPNHNVGDEWVYNEADIDNAAIVWARVTDPKHDKELIRYFRDRTVWLLEPDKYPWLLRPYFAR